MFTDVCFPNNNEDKFIEIAERLNTGCLLLIYTDKRKAADCNQSRETKLKILRGFFEKKHGFFGEVCVIGSEKKFCYLPDLRIKITQVHIKEIGALSLPLILQIGQLKTQMHPEMQSKLSFVLGLCNKYKVEVMPASCSTVPFMLVSSYETASLLKVLKQKSVLGF